TEIALAANRYRVAARWRRFFHTSSSACRVCNALVIALWVLSIWVGEIMAQRRFQWKAADFRPYPRIPGFSALESGHAAVQRPSPRTGAPRGWVGTRARLPPPACPLSIPTD